MGSKRSTALVRLDWDPRNDSRTLLWLPRVQHDTAAPRALRRPGMHSTPTATHCYGTDWNAAATVVSNEIERTVLYGPRCHQVAAITALSLLVMPMSGPATAAGPVDLVQLARAHVRIDADGLFVIGPGSARVDAARLHAVFDPLNAELSRVDRSLRLNLQQKSDVGTPTATTLRSGTGGHSASLAASWCGYIPRWAFEAYAWGVIIAGGVTATLALFAAGTIFGLPAAAVLGAAGIWLGVSGSYVLWFVDTYMPVWGVYVCVF